MAARSLRWVKDVLSRSIHLEHKRSHGPAATAEKGRGPAVDSATALLLEQRADLGARLLVHDPATQLVRNLFVIHDELGKRGWAGVEALPLSLVGRALTEAEILHLQEPSSLLTTIIETLRSIKISAEARAAQGVQEALEQRMGARAAGDSRGLRDQLRRIRADGAQLGRHRAGRARSLRPLADHAVTAR